MNVIVFLLISFIIFFFEIYFFVYKFKNSKFLELYEYKLVDGWWLIILYFVELYSYVLKVKVFLCSCLNRFLGKEKCLVYLFIKL